MYLLFKIQSLNVLNEILKIHKRLFQEKLQSQLEDFRGWFKKHRLFKKIHL